MKLLVFTLLSSIYGSSETEPVMPVQNFESEDLTKVPLADDVAVTNDFHIFKFWQESHGRKDTSFFIFENKNIHIGDQTTYKKMQETGYKGAGAALQALCA
jgi:hypothetical protein